MTPLRHESYATGIAGMADVADARDDDGGPCKEHAPGGHGASWRAQARSVGPPGQAIGCPGWPRPCAPAALRRWYLRGTPIHAPASPGSRGAAEARADEHYRQGDLALDPGSS